LPDVERFVARPGFRLCVGKWRAIFGYREDGTIEVIDVWARGGSTSAAIVDRETDVEILERDGGRRFAVVPMELWEEMLDKAEMREDIALCDSAVAALERGEEESVPSELVDRLLAGENPVKVWREYRGLGQRELAEKAGVAQAHVAQIETGRRKGSVDTLRRLAGAMRVDLDDLVP